MDVRKPHGNRIDRDTAHVARLEEDAAYREHARAVWAQDFDTPPTAEDIAEGKKALDKVLERAEAAVKKLRARGVTVIFVRPPSTGRYYEFEQRVFPRKDTWDVLLQRTGAPGIHFEDTPRCRDSSCRVVAPRAQGRGALHRGTVARGGAGEGEAARGVNPSPVSARTRSARSPRSRAASALPRS
jgi:hypothetical protein